MAERSGPILPPGGYKDKRCKWYADGKHQWTTFETKDTSGNRLFYAVCKGCMKGP